MQGQIQGEELGLEQELTANNENVSRVTLRSTYLDFAGKSDSMSTNGSGEDKITAGMREAITMIDSGGNIWN